MRLDIQLFATSGIINGSSTATGADYRIVWEEISRDESANTITLKIQPQIYKSGSSSTTGTFSGNLIVDGSTYSISKKFSPYNWGEWKSVATKQITISNASGKLVPISSRVTNTGTSMAGTYTASGNIQLDDLHNPPIINGYTITETNQDLIDAGIENNVFVRNLSIKSFDIDYELEEPATLQEARIFNGGTNIIGSEELPVIFDLQTNQLGYIVETLKVPILVGIIDSNDNFTRYPANTYDNYDLILYSKPQLDEISSVTKRIGQTTGRVGVTLNGTFFNGEVGNVSQGGEYKPTIKYKYWKYGDTEPSTFDNTIPSSAITIDGNSFKVSNYDIGSIVETDDNWFDPDYAWRFKFQINDNFTTIISSEKSTPKGIALWSEYKDRVDFNKITKQNINILSAKVLYDDDSGETGNITLNDDATKYEYLELFYSYSANNEYGTQSVRVPVKSGQLINISTQLDNGTYYYSVVCNYTINGNTLTKSPAVRWRIATGGGNSTRTANSGNIAIFKVIGYK